MARKTKKSQNKNRWISSKVERIMQEGVRRNTHKPYHPKRNPRRKVSQKTAVAIANSMYKRRNKV